MKTERPPAKAEAQAQAQAQAMKPGSGGNRSHYALLSGWCRPDAALWPDAARRLGSRCPRSCIRLLLLNFITFPLFRLVNTARIETFGPTRHSRVK